MWMCEKNAHASGNGKYGTSGHPNINLWISSQNLEWIYKTR